MSTPSPSEETPKPSVSFEDIWRQLGECHHNALQELEAKVNKLKKDRCLDAQRLEVFYNRNQQLKEQNKSLQDAISLLEERLHAGGCHRCAVLEEDLKNNQDQNLRLVTKLKNERNSLEEENSKLRTEQQKLKTVCAELQRASSSEQEDGIIPDSPVLPSSLPVTNKLKKRRNADTAKRVRYAERPLPWSNNSLFNELSRESVAATKKSGGAEVLVPNTCELDTSQNSSDANLHPEDMIAETCGFEFHEKPHMKADTAAGQRNSSESPRKYNLCSKPCRSPPLSTLIHSPDVATERSPSLLPGVKRLAEDGSVQKAKRKKESFRHVEEDDDGNQEVEGKRQQPERTGQSSSSLNNQSFKEPLDSKVHSAQNGTLNAGPNVSCASPAFKTPNAKVEAEKDGVGRRRKPLQQLNDQREGEDDERRHKVEPMWSIDPALTLSTYGSECRGDEPREEQRDHGELADTDCTWISHSLLHGRGEHPPDNSHHVSGLGEKANDSLDMMFDTTAYGEYKSYNSSHFGQSQPCEDDADADEDDEEDNENHRHENTLSPRKEHKTQRPTFAHVAVVRKKDERRKLKGTTCKECEIYYAHLPEEEKQTKLSACSRHRFLYVPPCTPEHFWEVGFPSTQTCIERGYIKEEETPQARPRRRRPYNALFSPKSSQQEN